MLVDVAMQTGVILGLTGLIGKTLPETWRDKVLPWCALAIGIFVVVVPAYMDVAPIFQGIILGGSVTGLYGVAKDMKQTPQVVVQK